MITQKKENTHTHFETRKEMGQELEEKPVRGWASLERRQREVEAAAQPMTAGGDKALQSVSGVPEQSASRAAGSPGLGCGGL